MTTVNRRLFIADLLAAGLLLAVACAGAAGGVVPAPGAGTSNASLSASAGSTASPTSGPTAGQHKLPAGFHRISNASKTISLGVPKDWTVINLAGNPDADLAKAGLADPAIRAQVIEELRAAGAAFVIDTASRAASSVGFLTNLIAFCSPAPGVSAETLKSDTRLQLTQAGATDIRMKDTTLDGRPAIHTTFSGALNGTETAALVDGKRCAVTLSTDQLPRYQRTFDQIAATTDIA
jgi:hypothetical protein